MLRDVRVQYFLTFATLGALWPYAPVLLARAGLGDVQIGLAFAIYYAASVLSPLIATRVADAHVDPRKLLALASSGTATGLLLLSRAHGVALTFAAWSIYCFASMPILPLQDGVHFSLQRRRGELGLPALPYHRVRVWGTIGYIVPTIPLQLAMARHAGLTVVLPTGIACALLAATSALRLHDPRGPVTAVEPSRDASRLPTAGAAHVLLHQPVRTIIGAALLLQVVASLHSVYYPLHLTQRVHLPEMWLGQASNAAVIVEIGWVAASGRLLRWLGTRRLLVIGALATALRVGLLAASPSVWVAIATQALHGLLIIATAVIPQMTLDESAEDRYRHSAQGMFVMLSGCGRTLTSAVSGTIAGRSLALLFVAATGLSVVAAAVAWFGLRRQTGTTAAMGVAQSRAADAAALPTSLPTEVVG